MPMYPQKELVRSRTHQEAVTILGVHQSLINKKRNFEYSYRLYLNLQGKRVLGKGGAQILEAINEQGSITAAAAKLGMSYKFVWDYLVRMRKILKEPVIVTHRGGSLKRRQGGGGTLLTPLAKSLLRDYRSKDRIVSSILSNK
jgi:molybdate transport system regulatory protein